VLNVLEKLSKIKRIVCSTYQSVSEIGKPGMDELYKQTKEDFMYGNNKTINFPKQIVFNCIPQIGSILQNGNTNIEENISVELRRILQKPRLKISITCVFVPVFVGHGISVNIEFDRPIDMDDVVDILQETQGFFTIDRQQDGGYITQRESVNSDEIYISRIRRDTSASNAINLWLVANNLRKGSALNAVQIALNLSCIKSIK
jgi:aspartate-semialdehyde dehydrogenase